MSDYNEQQHFFMRYALALGQKGRLTTPPNPWVGCVVVKENVIVGEGFHKAPGEPHAEIEALNAAGSTAKGATLYVTLEPCAHAGRTPPCTEALIKSGVCRVVIPFLDPDPNVSGKGVEALRQAGIEVEVGVCEAEAKEYLAPYLHHRKTGLPYCVLKMATSIDGRLAAADGSSKWITGEVARHDVHILRAASGAIVVGKKTAEIDRPQLTVRGLEVPHQTPLRVVMGSIEGYDLAWTESIESLLKELGSRGILQVLIEGGAELHTAFLPFAQQCIVYIGNCLLGPQGLPLFSALQIENMQEAHRWHLADVSRFEDDVRLTYTLCTLQG